LQQLHLSDRSDSAYSAPPTLSACSSFVNARSIAYSAMNGSGKWPKRIDSCLSATAGLRCLTMKIERRDQARAIRSSLAVNEDRFSGGAQKREQFLGALRTQLLAGGETKVDVIDLKSSRFRDLGFVPGAALVVAAKVDDSLDAILLGIVVKLLRL
jgi:hypothetical protein